MVSTSENHATIASPAAVDHLRWSLTEQVGPITFRRLIERFGSARAALGIGAQRLREIDGIGTTTAEVIARTRDSADVDSELALAEKHGVRIICPEDEEFPPALREIPDPPICLYVRGRIEPADAVAIAVVGARRCTVYGREQAYRFGYQLAQRGVTVVSGLARGIDGSSHKGALTAGGRTLAVLGNGLASIYPPEHQELADQIRENGAVISELPMTTSPHHSNFLPRNRLIAGMALGTLVVEAARRSGSLATARCAAEYNREIFALPGRVDSEFSAGTNGLIRDQHAKLVTCADDILDELGDVGEALRGGGAQAGSPSLFDASDAAGSDGQQRAALAAAPRLSEDEQAVLAWLDHDERSIETIAERSGRSAAKVAGALITLQLKGLARQLPGNLFVKPGKR